MLRILRHGSGVQRCFERCVCCAGRASTRNTSVPSRTYLWTPEPCLRKPSGDCPSWSDSNESRVSTLIYRKNQYYCPFAVASALRATLEARWRVSSRVVWEANPAQDVRPWRRQRLVRDSRLLNRISKPPVLSERFFRRSISVCWKRRRLDQSRDRSKLSTIGESEE